MDDFNAYHAFWEPGLPQAAYNTNGKALYTAITAFPFALLNPPGLTTRVDPYTCRHSILDLFFGGGDLANPCNVVAGPHIGGDHLPVILNYNAYVQTQLQKGGPRLKFNVKGWSKIREASSSMEVPPAESLEEYAGNLTTTLIANCHEAFKLKSDNSGNKPAKPCGVQNALGL